MNNLVNALEKRVALIAGMTVTGLAYDPVGYIGIVVKNEEQRFIIWALRDPEDNGPGFFSIDEALP